MFRVPRSNRTIILNIVWFFLPLLILPVHTFGQGRQTVSGWQLTGYNFVDGTSSVERVLAGTSSRMDDVTKFRGGKNDMEIAKNRFDKKTGKLLAGVTYSVKWTDPPAVLMAGERIAIQYELRTITAASRQPDFQSVKFDQGASGLFLYNTRGENYFRKDFSSRIVSDKVVEKGTPGKKRRITVNLGGGFLAIYEYEWKEAIEPSANAGIDRDTKPGTDTRKITGWHFTDSTFTDGTATVERVLAGTSSRMDDVTKFRGGKNDMEIAKNRFDKKTGKLLAGVTYSVKWTDPPAVLMAGERIAIQYELRTITAASRQPDFQSVKFDQGASGLFLYNTRGENYFRKDFSSRIVSDKVVEKGTPGKKRSIRVDLGGGYHFIYNYEWKEY